MKKTLKKIAYFVGHPFVFITPSVIVMIIGCIDFLLDGEISGTVGGCNFLITISEIAIGFFIVGLAFSLIRE